MKYEQLINDMLKDVLVFDIETSSFKNNTPISIKTDFNDYVKHAKVKWFGAYSYKYNQYYELNIFTQEDKIKELLSEHNVLVGFNSENFDFPIIKNNLLLSKKYYKNLDVMRILGSDNYLHGFKRRAMFMGVNLKELWVNNKKYGSNSLQAMAHAFGLDVSKGDIDYKTFFKEFWSNDETVDIKKYLRKDVEITKKLFDKLIDFWSLFTEWLNEEDVLKWVWVSSSIASLTYTAACRVKGVEPEFSDETKESEEMGGRAVVPIQKETSGAHYMDEASKYPHIFSEFNLFSEVDVSGQPQWKIDKLIEKGVLFHGNNMFEVRGYYDVRQHGKLEKDIVNKLKTRWVVKKILKDYKKGIKELDSIPDVLNNIIHSKILDDDTIKTLNGLQYAIKIFANALYGAARSNIFKNLYSKNCGWDCCWIGQQIHEYVHNFFEDKGFKVVGGFTDSWFIEDSLNGQKVSKEMMLELARQCFDELKKHMPFPQDTHIIDYECYIDYLLYSYDDKKKEFKKNNYVYISEGKVKIVGLPIMKSNASKLSILIFNKYLKPEGLKNNKLIFKRKYVEGLIKDELEKDITLAAVNYSCNNFSSYKNASQLQAQISRGYLNGLDGKIDVVKNKKMGKAGIGNKYCSVKEAVDFGLCYQDLILDKVWNELEPFIEQEAIVSLDDWL